MYLCKVCGGNTVFDIKTQQLVCPYCGDSEDPYARESLEQGAAKPDEFEVNVFTCPYCGGEIMSTDNEISGFCSFCGTSTTLQGRISKEKRPKYIIPFKKTKDDCKKVYLSKVNKAIYAPKELKDEKAIDSFRGIYMPYWSYHLTQDTPMDLVGTVKRKSGKNTVTDYYELKGHVNGYYKGLSFDSSSSFEDDISESIAPYNVKEMKEFTPAYLSGFYADMEDVPSEVYEEDAEEKTNEETIKRLKESSEFKRLNKPSLRIDTKSNKISTQIEGADNVMYPVWFMSYKKGNRVAYSTINGQTGKFAMDIPVDMKKYTIGTAILTLPILAFLLLSYFGGGFSNLFISVLLMIIGYIATFIHSSQLFNVINQNNNFSDKGTLYKETKNKKISRKTKGLGLKVVYSVGLIGTLMSLGLEDTDLTTKLGLIAFLITVIQLISLVIMLANKSKAQEKFHLLGDTMIVIGTVFLAICLLLQIILQSITNIILSFACVLTFIHCIKRFNVYSTRKLPQFDKKGGNDNA